ncbi:putative receptor protein kinase ZmPK1 isoform X2 [Mercurialis annua]|uniref:putative receptor protein kinase ZmPK1 isoform X2 n=1 Tax=Mercurialis annua TaxID=3986 RepID=UPI00215E5F42|nr:putative receptor protein kinase ZmPK1 isoform X2 [Mercurialis annua]
MFNMDCKFLLIAMCFILSVPASDSVLRGGSSLSVENPDDILISPNRVFSAGFYPVGENAYSFAVWFSKPSCTNNCTVVWMANRDFPVNVWSTGTDSISPAELRLNNTGNLVLQDTDDAVLWQSFNSPTDTLLPLQPFTRYTQLVSARSYINSSTGFYKLIFDDNNLMRLIYDGPEVSSVYWPYPWLQDWDGGRTPYNSTRIASYDLLGEFTSSDNWNFLAADYGSRLQRRLKIDSDGNVRMYSREEGISSWIVSWQSKSQLCEIHGICGPNSACFYDPVYGRNCSCLPGFKIKNPADWSYGCEPKFNISCENREETSFIKLEHVEFFGNDAGFYNQNVSLEMCKKYCLELCSCKGFQYRYIVNTPEPYCYPKMLLMNGQRAPNFGGDFYVKVPKTFLVSDEETASGFGLQCSNHIVILDRTYAKVSQDETVQAVLWLACALAGVEIITVVFVWCFLIKSNEATESYNPAGAGFRRFTFSELKKATKNFSQEIGRGAGGIVYKAVLFDDRVAAIKRLNIANQGEAEFLAEVSTIGKLNHMNLIALWGYCAEQKHRLLVYEFIEHGSLTENLSLNTLDWQKRFEIASGAARGLAYLHEECLEWVLHCDVKPQNILLDSNYQPKVSDFGLSKLLSRGDRNLNHSIFSKIRGTRGYMAPEWVYNLPITSKVDVYSYGIVVLEMITGKSPAIGETEHKGLVTLVRDKKKEADGETPWIESIVDPNLEGKYDEDRMESLVGLALQCVEEDRDARPSMSRVVEILLHHQIYN